MYSIMYSIPRVLYTESEKDERVKDEKGGRRKKRTTTNVSHFRNKRKERIHVVFERYLFQKQKQQLEEDRPHDRGD